MMINNLEISWKRQEEGVTWGDDDDLFRHIKKRGGGGNMGR